MPRRIAIPSLIAALALALVAVAGAETWTVSDGSEVIFRSEAPMESFEGKTDRISGHVTCLPADLESELDLRFAVDLASIDTGIGMRNTHMRERHLETDQYPEAVFTAGEIRTMSLPELTVGEPAPAPQTALRTPSRGRCGSTS